MSRLDPVTGRPLKPVKSDALPKYLYHGTEASSMAGICGQGMLAACKTGNCVWDVPMFTPEHDEPVAGTRKEFVYFHRGRTPAENSAKLASAKAVLEAWGAEVKGHGTIHMASDALFKGFSPPYYLPNPFRNSEDAARRVAREEHAPHVCRVPTHALALAGCEFYRDPEGVRGSVVTDCPVPAGYVECKPLFAERRGAKRDFEACAVRAMRNWDALDADT